MGLKSVQPTLPPHHLPKHTQAASGQAVNVPPPLPPPALPPARSLCTQHNDSAAGETEKDMAIYELSFLLFPQLTPQVESLGREKRQKIIKAKKGKT